MAGTLDADPGEPGPFAIVSSDYQLDPLPIEGMPEPIEMVGHVVEPAPDAATGPRPLVLFLHGRHSICYTPGKPDDFGSGDWPCKAPEQEIPGQLGYDYIQRILASQGYTTVSIRANGINAQDYRLADGGANARATLVAAQLDHWTDIAAAHQVDLSRVILVGHSRGGEGVARAALQIPLSAPYRIVGTVLIAPTDFSVQTTPYVPSVTLLPSCDGDVSDLQGQNFTDQARDVLTDDTALHSSVLVVGANHNFFNTEWTPGQSQAPSIDDWGGSDSGPCSSADPTRLSPQGQQAVGAAYVAGAARLFAGEQQFLPMFDGSPVRVASAGDAIVFSSAIGGGRDLRRPGADAGLSLPSDGADTRFCAGQVGSREDRRSCVTGGGYSRVTPHWTYRGTGVPTRTALDFSWSGAGQAGGLDLDRPLDVSAGRLELRTILDGARGAASLQVRLTDAEGASTTLDPEGGDELAPLPRKGMLWARTLVVDTSDLGDVDPTAITRVELVSGTASGRVWVLDVSATPKALPALQARRPALVSIGRVTVEEGDPPPAQRFVDVPVTVSGLTRSARVKVLVAGGRGMTSFPLDLAAGQTSARVRIPYVADRRDDDALRQQIVLLPVRGAMPDRYLGAATVRDDDPAPTTTISVPSTVREGGAITVKARVGQRSDRSQGLSLQAVTAPSPQLTLADLPKQWRTDQYLPDHRGWSLARASLSLYGQLEPGARSATLSIPIARDGVREGTEFVRLEVRLGNRHFARTIRVLDADGGR